MGLTQSRSSYGALLGQTHYILVQPGYISVHNHDLRIRYRRPHECPGVFMCVQKVDSIRHFNKIQYVSLSTFYDRIGFVVCELL